ncbi:MAG TPA: class I SAM-dependent methyltransferase [Solirubrobacteraceae bacterium]|nr:class I SAM-dependent methyltransferase [Solirubrobacteraceae bacterium]
MAGASPYDAVLYPARAFIQTHPDRLATLATLFGLSPAPPARCRVLELGCGAGGNLLPMAAGLPGSTFVGIDTSRRSIERAQAVTQSLGLTNITFEEISLDAFEAPAGSFDYVIAHGVFSWIADSVRDALLALSASVLSEHGVAYVSYNALPGGHGRQALREMLAYHVRELDGPEEKMAAARGFLRLLSAAREADPELAKSFGAEARRLADAVDGLFFHDTLAEHNRAFYFHEFTALAAAHGLQYLSEAEFSEMQVDALPEQLQKALLTISDPLAREQYLDFLKERMFRQTLLCHAGAEIDRTPRPERLAGLAASAPLRWTADETSGRLSFAGPGGAHLTTDHPLVTAALQQLGNAWPAAVPVQELAPDGQLETVCDALLRCFAANLVRLHVHPPAVSVVAPARPQVSALARLEAAQGEMLTTVRHTALRLDDELGRRLVTLLDGTRDRAALLEELAPGAAMDRDELAAALEQSLAQLARAGMLLPVGAA